MNYTLFIDIGSNTIKALLACFERGSLRPLGEFSLPRRISAKGGLSEEAANIITSSVLELNSLARAKLKKDFETVCFGTSALRDSPNSKQVLRELLARGICVRVLTGEQEAKLSFKGAMGDEALRGKDLQNALYGDLGGGSMEFVSKSGGGLAFESLPIGAVRLTNKFSESGVLDAEKLKNFCRQNLEKVEIPPSDFTLAISGGAVTAARFILGGGKLRAESEVAMGDLKYCLEECETLGSEGLIKKYALPANRVDILPAAFYCLIEVLKAAGRESFTHTRRSLRYGVAELYYGI